MCMSEWSWPNVRSLSNSCGRRSRTSAQPTHLDLHNSHTMLIKYQQDSYRAADKKTMQSNWRRRVVKTSRLRRSHTSTSPAQQKTAPRLLSDFLDKHSLKMLNNATLTRALKYVARLCGWQPILQCCHKNQKQHATPSQDAPKLTCICKVRDMQRMSE